MVLSKETLSVDNSQLESLIEKLDENLSAILDAVQNITDKGKNIDDFQKLTEDFAYLATQNRAVQDMNAFNIRMQESNQDDHNNTIMTSLYLADVLKAMRDFLTEYTNLLNLSQDDFENILGSEFYDTYNLLSSEERIRNLGKSIIASRGVNNVNLEDEVATLTREMARDFANKEVAPIAQDIHREDLLVPDNLIKKFSEQGFFGSSIPSEYGGTGMGDLSMIIITEELSAASLAAAGSLSTRPEILTKALLAGGTEDQRKSGFLKLLPVMYW